MPGAVARPPYIEVESVEPDGGYRIALSPAPEVGTRALLAERFPPAIDRHTFVPRIVAVECVRADGGAQLFVPTAHRETVAAAAAAVEMIRRDFAWLNALHDELGAEVMDPEIRFGFLDGFACAWAVWRDHRRRLLATQPIRWVRFLDWPVIADIEDVFERHAARITPLAVAAVRADDPGLVLREVFNLEWPGIEFRFPTP